MKHLVACTLTSFSIFAASLHGETSNISDLKEEMIDHLIGIKNTFQGIYAPAAWKKEYLGWDIKTAVQAAIEKVERTPNISLKDYHKILKTLFQSAQDYHVNVHLISTESAGLPFRVRGAKDRYFVVWVDPEISNTYPVHVGDEILTFDGKKTSSAINDLIMTDQQERITETDKELASILLTHRGGVFAHTVPQGRVKVTSKSRSSGKVQNHLLEWTYFPELIKDLYTDLKEKKASSKSRPKNRHEAIRKFAIHSNMENPFCKIIANALKSKAFGASPMFDRYGPLPFLKTPLWVSEEDKFFFSYIIRGDAGKQIGYIRIPHFLGSDDFDDGQSDREELRLLLQVFQRKTDGLVLDLLDNSGGFSDVLISYLSLVADRPLQCFKHRVSITQHDVMQSLVGIAEIHSMLENNDIELSQEDRIALLQIIDYFIFILNEWDEGRTLSNPVSISGVDYILPDSAAYTKPILILTNALDFSCADVFPAILQDAGRATIFGTKTAGAGGAIEQHTYPNKLGVEGYSYTTSLIERNNMQPLENLGVTPDIIYQVTPNDLQNQYSDYRKEVIRAIESLL